MKTSLLAAGAFAVALAMPLGVYAQQSQAPSTRAYGRSHTTPSRDRIAGRWSHRFGRLNLSGDQQQRMQSIIDQYSQTHPEGSPRDPQANRELRRQLMGVLSPDQQNQFRQQMRARRAAMRQRRGQMQQGGGQYQQGGYDRQDQQGGYGQQYQQGGYGQQYQQGGYGQQYPDQRYQQGPQEQYPQGAPQQGGPYQGGPEQGPPGGGEAPPPDQQGPPA